VPEILEISAPSSLANFLTFGLAELFPFEAGTLGAGCCCCFEGTTSFCFFSFLGSFFFSFLFFLL
jgi:hypothetical protein